MTGTLIRIPSAALAIILSAIVVLAQSADPWIGTWQINLAKSKFSPGPPARSNTLKMEAVAGGAQKVTFHLVDDEGTLHVEYVTKFDGVEVPVQAMFGETKIVQTNVSRRLADRSYEHIFKTDGKQTLTVRGVVSPDGKTLTLTTTGTDNGKPFNNITVFEKQ